MFFANKVYELRQKAKMTQEEFADLFHVSRQTVQKWESGIALPETSKIIKISKYFGISTDALLLDNASRIVEESKHNCILNYDSIPEWEFYSSAVLNEYKQSLDEGLDIERYKMLFESISGLPKNNIKKELGNVVQKIVESLPNRKDYQYCEPSQLDEIKELQREFRIVPDNETGIEEKIHGAWLGRVCGCMLGKTVEGVKRPELKRFLTETDNFPMKRYIYKSDLKKIDLETYNYNFSAREYADEIHCMPADDDTNYTVLAQIIFDEYGDGFTPENVAAAWCKYQSKDAYCTAERVAYCNFIKGYLPPQSATHKNPYREWIGAQIRADYWGYINPGKPEKAAEMAWRDASISHVKNGIYGEMFVAAMIASASQTDSIKNIILSGLSQIPYSSRLHQEITDILERYENGKTQKEVFDHIHRKYNENEEYDWCHTIPNAMIVVASLLYGNDNFGKSICMAVETGFDTDCNGATVGSILGMKNGISSIDEEWKRPFNDMLSTSIFGLEQVSISERVEMTLEHINSKLST